MRMSAVIACAIVLLPACAWPADRDFWTADQRLSQKVTCILRHKSVSSILALLQAQTGVRLKAGYTDSDWQVRDRKMDIFARDLALGDLMQSIARVMKFKWDRSGEEGKWRYRLFMDRRTLLESEARMCRLEEEFAKKQAQKRTALLDKLSGLARMSPQDLAKMENDDPFTYALASSGTGAALDRLFAASPAAREAFLEKQELTVSAQNLGPEGQEAALALLRGLHAMRAPLGGSAYKPLPDDIADRAGSINITFNPEPSLSDSDAPVTPFFQRITLGQITAIYSTGQSTEKLQLPVLDPDSGLSKALGKALIGPAPTPGADGATVSFSYKMDPTEFAQADFGEPQIEHPDNKEPKTEIDLAPKGDDPKKAKLELKTPEDLFAAISDASRMSVVADCYGPGDFHLNLTDARFPLRGMLDMMSMMLTRNWWISGSTIELRDRYWFRKRSLQIPEAWLEKWRETFKKTGTLEIDDLADMARLTGESAKYAANIGHDDVLNCWSMTSAVRDQWRFLQFYASLDAEQRARIYTESGLSGDDLTQAQWQLAARHDSTWKPGSGLVIKGSRKVGQFRPWEYSFRASTTDGASSYVAVNSPKYEPPKKSTE